jgi:2-keto-myo-inositol isomerase
MRSEQFAINAISTANASLEELCPAYAAAGFRQVEFPIKRLKEWMGTDRRAADVRELLGSHGLRCVGGFEVSVLAFADDQVKVKESQQRLISNGQLLSHLGGGVMVVGSDSPEIKTLNALEQLGKAMSRLVDQIPSNVSMALEFNWSELAKSLKGAYVAVAAANHPRVGLVFDPAHLYTTASKTEDLTDAVIQKIIHVHVNDMCDKPGDLSDCNGDRVLPGEGCLDLKSIFSRIEQGGYKGLYSIELFNADLWKLPVDECARRCYAAMEQLAKDVGE